MDELKHRSAMAIETAINRCEDALALEAKCRLQIDRARCLQWKASPIHKGETMPKNDGTVVMEGVRIIFRNFAGKEGQYNREGDRNFAVLLDDDIANQLTEDGWNVKWLKPHEDDEEETQQAYLQVSVNFDKGRPPRVMMITSRGRTNLGANEVDMLDWADITNVDLIVRPYTWEVSGKTGIKAYLQSLYATIEEDELERKYAEVEMQ